MGWLVHAMGLLPARLVSAGLCWGIVISQVQGRALDNNPFLRSHLLRTFLFSYLPHGRFLHVFVLVLCSLSASFLVRVFNANVVGHFPCATCFTAPVRERRIRWSSTGCRRALLRSHVRIWMRWVWSEDFNFCAYVWRMMLGMSLPPSSLPFALSHLIHTDPHRSIHVAKLIYPHSFCAFHTSTSDPDTKATWLLHRDLLHALTMPVVQLFRRAASLAQAALCTSKNEDLELAFSGDARGAFVWLQCFLGEEDDWCCTKGCPGEFLWQLLSRDGTGCDHVC